MAVVIVCYLYPKAAKDAREERDRRDKDAREERDRRDAMWLGMVQGIQTKFESRNQILADSIEKQTNALTTEFGKNATRIEQAVINVCRGRFEGTRREDHPS